MTALRRLPAEEYSKLKTVYDHFCPDPRSSRVVVAEKDGEIIGRVMLLAPVHLEGPWVRDDFRGTPTAKRLMDRAEVEARECGLKDLFAYGANEEMGVYLLRLGYKPCPFTVWKKEL